MAAVKKAAVAIAFLTMTPLSLSSAVQAREATAHETMISTYVEAYNARDLDAMQAMMHPDIQWIAVDGGKSEVVADGREALVEQMQSYFASPSETRSTIGDMIENGRFLTMRETAHWKDSSGAEKAQSSIVVYELEDGLVRRVWYYPAQG